MIDSRDKERIHELALGEIEFLELEEENTTGKLKSDFEDDDFTDLMYNLGVSLQEEYGDRFDVRLPEAEEVVGIETVNQLADFLCGLVSERIP